MPTYYKLCRRCRCRKLVEEFQLKSYANGRYCRRHICTQCRNEETRKETTTPSGKANRRHIVLKHKYGITLDEYDEFSAYQNHVCAICSHICNTGQPLSVDHCHETKRVRGLLCRKCNVAIGTLKTIELLQRAINYISEPM